MKTQKSAIDLTDLALGIVVLGVVVSIGAVILVNLRDAKLTELSTYYTTNEQLDFGSGTSSKVLANSWFKQINNVTNASDGDLLLTGNYSTTVDGFGKATVANLTNTYPYTWNVTYTSYNVSSRTDYTLADDASVGIGEFGSWFKIIAIVGIAAVILALIFTAFGGRNNAGSVSY